MRTLSWERRDVGSARVLEIVGDADVASKPELDELLESLIDEGPGPIVVSFERCTFCDSTILGVMVKFARQAAGRFDIVAGRGSRVRRVFDITGLTGQLGIFETVDAAVAAHDGAGAEPA